MPVDDIVAPLAASPWWMIVGLLLVACVAAWFFFVFWSTRRRPAPAEAVEPEVVYSAGGDPFGRLRATYLGKVDESERAFRAQEIDVRELHLQLSSIVREFAGHRRGVDTTVMTLTEIERLTGAGRLANLIAHYYQPSFSEFSEDSGTESVQGARTVISSW